MTKSNLEALEKAIITAAKKNSAPPDGDNFSGLECNELFLEIKYESNNTFNPIWVKLLNKNGDIPSGVQLNDLLDQVRIEAFKVRDIQRRIYLESSRKRAAELNVFQMARILTRTKRMIRTMAVNRKKNRYRRLSAAR